MFGSWVQGAGAAARGSLAIREPEKLDSPVPGVEGRGGGPPARQAALSLMQRFPVSCLHWLELQGPGLKQRNLFPESTLYVSLYPVRFVDVSGS